jgi:primosomal protein N'
MHRATVPVRCETCDARTNGTATCPRCERGD